jgi:hypothetical protein
MLGISALARQSCLPSPPFLNVAVNCGSHRDPSPNRLFYPENWLPHGPEYCRSQYADTRTILPVDNHGHNPDFSAWTFTREHRGQRRPHFTCMPSLPGVVAGLHKRRHVALGSPEEVFAGSGLYTSPVSLRTTAARADAREVAASDDLPQGGWLPVQSPIRDRC